MTIQSHIVYICFHATTAELHSSDKRPRAHKAKNIDCLAHTCLILIPGAGIVTSNELKEILAAFTQCTVFWGTYSNT